MATESNKNLPEKKRVDSNWHEERMKRARAEIDAEKVRAEKEFEKFKPRIEKFEKAFNERYAGFTITGGKYEGGDLTISLNNETTGTTKELRFQLTGGDVTDADIEVNGFSLTRLDVIDESNGLRDNKKASEPGVDDFLKPSETTLEK